MPAVRTGIKSDVSTLFLEFAKVQLIIKLPNFVSSIAAKKDPRIRDSGEVVGFSLMGNEFETEPKTYFYDWLYINTLMLNPDLADQLMEYDAFTDIEFNPNRSLNCQAEAAAIYVGLRRNDLLKSVMDDKKKFREILTEAK